MNISGKINAAHVAVYRDVSNAAKALKIQFVVVGAAARDLVLHYGCGARVVRATTDIDFGIQVADVASYESLLARLTTSGYKESGMSHRLISPCGVSVDLVPFGPIESDEGDVLLPSDETHRMNVVGFQEACDSADQVTIQTKSVIVIPVASPPGVALLKIIAWTERVANLRRKDALDLGYLMENYEKIPVVTETIYANLVLLERFEFDVTLAGAFVLGRNTNSIASESALNIIAKMRNGEIKDRTIETLEYEMCRNSNDDELARKSVLLDAFLRGFSSE